MPRYAENSFVNLIWIIRIFLLSLYSKYFLKIEKQMENYNEKVNYGTEKQPRWKDRLIVNKTTYGYSLYDRKEKKALIARKSIETCNNGMRLLLAGDFDGFEKLVEEVKNEVIVEPKIILFKGKHTDNIFYANTYEQLGKVAIHVLEERLSMWYIAKWGVPEELDYTFDDIENLPVLFREEAKKKLSDNKKKIKEATDNNRVYESAVRAVEEKNGALAWTIIQNRANYEYEEYELIEPIDL